MKVAKNAVVSMHYTLTMDDGTEVDSSVGGEPLVFLFGSGEIIPGLENALQGKATGDQLKVKIAPTDGYGEYDKNLTRTVPRKAFQSTNDLAVGMQFEAMTEDGPVVMSITKVEGDNITVDANHPLAGKNLNFDVKIVAIREATKDEVTHGHAHGAHGHDHHHD